ncbi:MAG: (d)CMP kinase [Clostridiales Family XIII bacterium]|nr:(d)CMP kinase [Clostridiales Family XIII bacterium]
MNEEAHKQKIIRIAVDGPSGAGKSTIARLLAERLGIDYIDTGAMYRAIALKILRNEIDAVRDSRALNAMLSGTSVDFSAGQTLLDGEDVSERIRTPEVTDMASRSSALPAVRAKLVALQREMGARKSVIMDGRDIGTNVFPDAEVKFFMTASAEERARRRYTEMLEKGIEADLTAVFDAIVERDYNDSHRELNPLSQAEDAILIDTDGKSIEAVTQLMLAKIESVAAF